ncbi:MAG: hypothetical protein M1828_001725 [Chrysothrix sp. TS-e1954]|nr:MAG: hypothetical protein M1828_001725 [Chrysothrix sp. TS-e1954]
MEQNNLRTASTYINNLLLARGLLRNGKPIDFAQLGRSDKQFSAQERSSTTSAEVINVVHDLILRRDRDQEHHESLAFTLRSLRSDNVKATTAADELTRRNDELKRQLAACQSSTRTAQTSAQQAESAARSLREETSRLKTLLGQVRTQCANDIRKRDVQIQKLKTHLVTRQRGSRTGMVGPSITITPGASKTQGASGAGGAEGVAPTLADAEYSLKQESTEFLTQLSQGLSDENDSLIGLIRDTVHTLQDLQGLPHNQMQAHSNSAAHGSTSQQSQGSDPATEDLVQVSSTSYQTLASDLQGVLGSLGELLTSSSFAPIEEVYVREEEIQRLKEGWQKMESRWKEAVGMMQGWSKRMQDGGHTIELEELKQGLGLGEGLQGINDVLPKTDAAFHDTEEASPDKGLEDDLQPNEIDEAQIELPSSESSFAAVEEPLVSRPSSAFKGVRDSVKGARVGLKEINNNVGARSNQRRVSFGLAKAQDEALTGSVLGGLSLEDSRGSAEQAAGSGKPISTRSTTSGQPHKIPPELHASSPAPQRNLSVSQKLQLAEREARRVSSSPAQSVRNNQDIQQNGSKRLKNSSHAANKRQSEDPQAQATAGVEQGKLGNHATATTASASSSSPLASPVKSPVKQQKRIRIGGRPRRRKSTLSPEELEGLLSMG